jgi:hypothetical protein
MMRAALREAISESATIQAVREEIFNVLRRPAPPPPDLPGPFVSVLVTGIDPDGKRLMLGGTSRVVTSERYFEIDTYVELHSVSVVVFCDLERVAIDCIRIGKDAINCGGNSCPMGTFREWFVGVRLGVLVRRLDGAR